MKILILTVLLLASCNRFIQVSAEDKYTDAEFDRQCALLTKQDLRDIVENGAVWNRDTMHWEATRGNLSWFPSFEEGR